MWEKIKKILGYTWASPVTAVGLAYAGTCQLAGWYKWRGVRQDGLVWQVTDSSPNWLLYLWKTWAGHAVGNVVVLNCDPDTKLTFLEHELVHVRQCMRLGVLHPIVYGISMLAIWIACESSSPYYSNFFEIDARRTVGQVVDVEGLAAIAAKKLKSSKVDLNKS